MFKPDTTVLIILSVVSNISLCLRSGMSSRNADGEEQEVISTSVARPDPLRKKGEAYSVPQFDFDKAESEILIPDAEDVSTHFSYCCER